MLKITDFTEIKKRAVQRRDYNGTFYVDYEDYETKRVVRTIESGPRFAHFLIDYFFSTILVSIISIPFVILQIAFEKYDAIFEIAKGIFCLFGLFGYYVLCEYKWQRTLGKYITKSYVINEYAEKPDLRQIILRNISRIVPFEPFSCLGDKYSYGWHDKWSDTFVVKEDELKILKEMLQ